MEYSKLSMFDLLQHVRSLDAAVNHMRQEAELFLKETEKTKTHNAEPQKSEAEKRLYHDKPRSGLYEPNEEVFITDLPTRRCDEATDNGYDETICKGATKEALDKELDEIACDIERYNYDVECHISCPHHRYRLALCRPNEEKCNNRFLRFITEDYVSIEGNE